MDALAFLVVRLNEPLRRVAQARQREVVDPCVAVRLHPRRVGGEHRYLSLADRLPGLVVRVALVDPVSLSVGGDGLPLQGVDLRLLDDPQLVFPGEVVTDIPVVQNSRSLMRRVLDEEGDGHGRAGTGVEDLASLPPRELTRSALVAPQVVDVEVGELLGQGEAHAVGRVAVDEAAVSDEADDPGLPDAIRGPADGPQVGVVQ